MCVGAFFYVSDRIEGNIIATYKHIYTRFRMGLIYRYSTNHDHSTYEIPVCSSRHMQSHYPRVSPRGTASALLAVPLA